MPESPRPVYAVQSTHPKDSQAALFALRQEVRVPVGPLSHTEFDDQTLAELSSAV